MQIEEYPFKNLPFSKLFKTYTSDFSKLSDFYTGNPFDWGDWSKKASDFAFTGDRDAIAEALKDFNQRFGAKKPALDNIERLREDNALAVVTGQQVNVYGGPLYTVFKTLTVLDLAREAEQKLGRPVVPVFWLGDEDHDFREMTELVLPKGDEVSRYEPEAPGEPCAVAGRDLGGAYHELREAVRQHLRDTDFSGPLWDLIDRCYAEDSTYGDGFARFFSELFSERGLVLAGSLDSRLKELCKSGLITAVEKAGEIREALEEQSGHLETDFHRQVTLYDSNIFFHDPEHGRQKIHRSGSNWSTDNGRRWSQNELLGAIDEDPASFSPNVFTRPVLQDKLLPTIAYVGGPGEVAYYGQMKAMYPVFDLDMPLIVPRFSGTLVESSIQRIMEKLPFDFSDYHERIEDLESRFVEQAEKVDIEAIFSEWKERAESISAEQAGMIGEVDPTLVKAAGKATSVYFNELDKLKGKVYRATKQQEQTQLNRIHKIKAQLFPDGGLQERSIALIYFMNKYGLDLWDRLLEAMDETEKFDRHKLVYL